MKKAYVKTYIKTFTLYSDLNKCTVIGMEIDGVLYWDTSLNEAIADSDAKQYWPQRQADHIMSEADIVRVACEKINLSDIIVITSSYDLDVIAHQSRFYNIPLYVTNKEVIDLAKINQLLEPTTLKEKALYLGIIDEDQYTTNSFTYEDVMKGIYEHIKSIIDQRKKEEKPVFYFNNNESNACSHEFDPTIAVAESNFERREDGHIYFTKGQHQGEMVARVCKSDGSYVKWVFSWITRETAEQIKNDYNSIYF